MKKILVGLVVLVVLAAGGLWYVINSLDALIEAAIERYGSEATGVSVSVGAVRISLREGVGSIEDLVIGSPEGEELCAIPAFTPDENLMAIESEARILKDGTLEGTFTMEGHGISDGRLRGVRAYREKADVGAYLEGWLGYLTRFRRSVIEAADGRNHDYNEHSRDR